MTANRLETGRIQLSVDSTMRTTSLLFFFKQEGKVVYPLPVDYSERDGAVDNTEGECLSGVLFAVGVNKMCGVP